MPFTKKYEDLTDAEKTVWATSYDVLAHGDTLYGEGDAHIAWAIRQALHTLDKGAEEYGSAMLVLELRKDKDGYGIAFIPMK